MVGEVFTRFKRPIPDWYLDAKLGFMVSWGAFSVPAWAEPIGELGTISDWKRWFKHNPYAEWYYNTIRIEGSPAQKHHREVHGGAPYDNFLDQWKAEAFKPDEWAQLFKYAGAQYIVPLSKHCDGITLWDAPGTGTRNTVARGPKRDLIGAIAESVRKVGIKFGVYYSGGLDWSVDYYPPMTLEEHVRAFRPTDAAYAMYCYEHIMDLINRYKPDVLWNDIEYPDFAKREGAYSLAEIFDHYYKSVPQGVVNDRWCVSHADYKTSEYQYSLNNESGEAWENCRGIGLSFGYNQVESEEHSLSVAGALRHFLDIVSRGGNFLLNVGPTASGEIPEIQRKVLVGLGDWMAINSGAVYATRSIKLLQPSNKPWARWVAKQNKIYCYIDSVGQVELDVDDLIINEKSAKVIGNGPIIVNRSGRRISMTIRQPKVAGPTVVEFDKI